mgnify:CR=1 FL=1
MLFRSYQLNKDLPVYKAGERYVGVTNTTKDRDPTKPWGYWGSVFPMTGKPAWRTPLIELPSWSGSVVTAGGLVFTGNVSGDFAALDEATKPLAELLMDKAMEAMLRARGAIG